MKVRDLKAQLNALSDDYNVFMNDPSSIDGISIIGTSFAVIHVYQYRDIDTGIVWYSQSVQDASRYILIQEFDAVQLSIY